MNTVFWERGGRGGRWLCKPVIQESRVLVQSVVLFRHQKHFGEGHDIYFMGSTSVKVRESDISISNLKKEVGTCCPLTRILLIKLCLYFYELL